MKQALLGLGLLLALGASIAKADSFPGVYDVNVATAMYDCPPGPGYLGFTVYSVRNVAFTHQIFSGSVATCQTQADHLFKTRATFPSLKVVGICEGQDQVWYLKRWTVDVWGRQIYQGSVYYGTFEACLAAADRTNT